MAIWARVENDEEMRKRLLPVARQGVPAMILDNLVGAIESEALCAYLTADTWSDRVLGASEMTSAPVRTLVLLTGNNISLVGDLNRRVLRVVIDPQMERPHTRRFCFDPEQLVRESRLDMVRDVLLILNAYRLYNDAPPTDSMASFETWSDFVRQTVLWIGREGWLSVDDPLKSIDASYGLDPETIKLRALLKSWQLIFGRTGGTVTDAINRIKSKMTWNYEGLDDSERMLRESIEEVTGKPVGDTGGSRILGRWIQNRAGRIVGGLRFVQDGTWKERARWIAA